MAISQLFFDSKMSLSILALVIGVVFASRLCPRDIDCNVLYSQLLTAVLSKCVPLRQSRCKSGRSCRNADPKLCGGKECGSAYLEGDTMSHLSNVYVLASTRFVRIPSLTFRSQRQPREVTGPLRHGIGSRYHSRFTTV